MFEEGAVLWETGSRVSSKLERKERHVVNEAIAPHIKKGTSMAIRQDQGRC